MEIEYVIVQAGGKGTRLKHLTENKPKALVPVNNLPLIFHLFAEFPDKKFIIIADHKKEVLREYMECFATVKYLIVDAQGTGTCAGVGKALNYLDENTPFLLIWSDLILPKGFSLPEERQDYIGISQTFPCRWSYENGRFKEERSTEHGVAGFFIFTDKSKLEGVPDSGELVRWMQGEALSLKELGLAGTREFGVIEEYNKLEKDRCRPFNKVTIRDDVVLKEGIDEQGKKLAVREAAWYKAAGRAAVQEEQMMLPRIYGTDPLVMERIHGKNIYEYDSLSYSEKKDILDKLIGALKSLHDSAHIPADPFSMREAYYRKTVARLNTIRDLVPFADREKIIVNGKVCRNVFFHKRELESRLAGIRCESFCLIHGDCTFSNLMLREDGSPVLIDPRGYFGYTEIFGDPLYDWAKLYYSIVGNYDRFNLKEFELKIMEEGITLKVQSNHWEDMEEDFFRLTRASEQEIKLIHAVIWLSLTTYAWQDFDSICGAFYNGLYYLEEVL
ncbi:MAG: phosphotransferase [Firmicutes bacterium]|nr:phosphotransferase [Bacillota bacterium]